MAPNPTQTQPAASLSATVQNIDPVISASNKRIKNLLAQTSIEKIMLDNHIKEMTNMAERHMQYVKDGEAAEMLVDRAVQLKSKVRKGEELEESLINNLSNLTLLLELLNLEGDEEQKTKGMRLGNKVTSEIEKYKGSVEEFHHKFRATLTFAISRRQDSSANSSQNSSRNTLLDRRHNRMHDHLKPNKVCWDDEVEVM